MRRKIIRTMLFLFATIIGIFATSNNVYAEEYTGGFVEGGAIESRVYINKRQSDGYTRWQRATMIKQSSTGQIVYCLQPMVMINDDAIYNVTTEDYLGAQNLTSEQYDRIKLLAYYGYGYGSHTSTNWISITQTMIWRTVRPDLDIFYSWDAKAENRDDSIFANEIAEFENLISNHYSRPSFNTNSIQMFIGETKSITDNNGVLSLYSIKSTSNVDASISGNNLNITANTVGSGEVILEKNEHRFGADPILFYAIDSQNIIKPGDPKPVSAKLNINVVGGKIKLIKKDSETNTITAQGQATLVGAKYGIYNSSNQLVDTLTIGSDSTATTKELRPDTYSIKELEPSKGYNLNNTVYHITVSSSDTYDVVVKEDVIKNYISILKQYDYVDGNTTLLNAESGITFEIYYPNGTKYSQITTDRNGYATINMPYGVWRFHQVNTNTGFEKIYDFYVTVDENSSKEQYYNVLNNKLSTYLQVIKVDEDTGKTIALANTKFKIFNMDTNQYISQYVAGKVYDTFETDDEGKFMTYLKIEAGYRYKLVEISSPKNYLINTEGVEFTIGEDTHYSYTTYGPVVTITFSDKQIKGVIEVNKNGETFTAEDETFNYNGRTNLEGIVYKIEANEDIMSADGNYVYYKEGTLVDTITTNNSGYAKSKSLPLGKYRIYEYSTLENYRLDPTVYEVELTEKDNRTAIVYSNLELTNVMKKGDLEFTKTDLVNGEPIKDTTISIYTESDEKIFEGKTNEEGKIIIKDLPVGIRMYIIETDCEGYVLSDEKVYFEITEDGEVVKAEMKNKPITGTLEFTKLNFVNDEPVENTLISIYSEDGTLEFSGRTDSEGKLVIENIRYGKHYILEEDAPEQFVLNTEKMWFEITEDGQIIKAEMKNKVKTSIIKIHKVDENNNPIKGVEIGIYDLDGNLLFSDFTDENGDIETTMTYGSYYWQEIAGVDGFIMSDEKVYFDVTEDGEVIQKTLVNETEEIEIPNTEANFDTIVIPIGFISIGIILMLLKRRKKDK